MEHNICPFRCQPEHETVLLRCGHPICSKYAQNLVLIELFKKYKPADHYKISEDNQSVEIACPICATKTEASQGLKNLSQPEVKKCTRCQKAPTVSCMKCPGYYCDNCFDQVHSIEVQYLKNHTKIDINYPICLKHNQLLDKFCELDQTLCCYKCFEKDHKGHKEEFVSKLAKGIKDQKEGIQDEGKKQIDSIGQTLRDMEKLVDQANELHTQFESEVEESFDRAIKLLETKRDALLTKSNRMRDTTLNNISLQCQVLSDLKTAKTKMVEHVSLWPKEENLQEDLQVVLCNQLLKNKDMIDCMLKKCESGKLRTHVNLSSIELVIDKLADISEIPMDTDIPIVSGLMCNQDENKVTVQWDPVLNYPIKHYVIQIEADYDGTTNESFIVPPNKTSYQFQVQQNWKQLMCTIYCETVTSSGPKSSPLIINLLKMFQLAHLQLKEKCSKQIAETVQVVFKQKGTQLNLNDCKLDNSGAIAMAQIVPHLKQLQELRLDGNQIGDIGATAIANAIKKLTKLQQLNVSNNQIGASGASEIGEAIRKLTQLQVLDLSDNLIIDQGATAIANAVSKLTALKSVSLSGNQIGNLGAAAVAIGIEKLAQLEELNLQRNRIEDNGATKIANAAKKLTKLQKLNIHQNLIGDSGITAIAGALNQLTSLQVLSVSDNLFGKTGIINIAKVIKGLTKLQMLNFSNNRIGNSEVSEIATAIQGLTKLQCLFLFENQIGDDGAIKISNVIQRLTNLQSIGLSQNQIGDPGATEIANKITRLTQLREVYLSANRIGDNGANTFANCVSRLPSLRVWQFENNNISAQVKENIKGCNKLPDFLI